ncbi:MAG: TetR family transcriptional regulator [Rhizobiaceae bacterium]
MNDRKARLCGSSTSARKGELVARTIAKDHDAKRRLIRDRAAAVFAGSGFDKASMSLLAIDCGISKASIYHYYQSKDALLFDILDNHLRNIAAKVGEVASSNLEPVAKLDAMILSILLAYRGADDEHRLQFNSLSALPGAQQEELRGHQRRIVDMVRKVLREVRPDTMGGDARRLQATTMSLFGMLNWFYMWNRDDSEQARIDYARLVASLLKGGLGAIGKA